MAKVLIENVHKVYPGGIVAVNDVNLVIEDQEFVVLVGPSGCGKSTTLRMVAGLEEISSGSIWIDGKKVNDVPPKDRDIAMVFQNYALYPHMTVYKNMAFGLKLRRMSSSEIERRVGEAADILGIQDLFNRKPKELSGGQRQRVAVGRAIVRKPKAFLFDEPLSNLDAKMRVQMRMEINKLHTRLSSTMIYVTHDQVEAMTMGDRIVVMKDGVIQQVAEPMEIYNRPANRFVAGFIGSPPMNFIEGAIRTTGHDIWFVAEGIKLKVDADHAALFTERRIDKVVLGIRAEDIADSLFISSPVPGYQVEARVEVVEPMGAEIFLYLRAGVNSFIAKVAPSMVAVVNQLLPVQFNMNKAHFFDAISGEAYV